MEQKTQKTEPATPRLQVDLPIVSQRKSFALKEPTIQLLTDYATFLSAHHGQKIEDDLVLEGLITGLSKDRLFQAWRRESGHA